MRRKAWPDPLAICVGPSALRFSGGSVPGPSAQAGICRAFSACARMAEMEIRPRVVCYAISALGCGWWRWRFDPLHDEGDAAVGWIQRVGWHAQELIRISAYLGDLAWADARLL